ncbi:MAG: MAPEG family protein [Cycloclasticus sp.]|nr:MAPEG family protein [Cycloclasticus sp.]
MIYPLSMMLLLVLILFGLLFIARMSALYTKKVDLKYFEVFKGAKPPSYLTKVTNNLNNVFEVPPLFYMAATLVMVLNLETDSILFNAWSFVIARYIHSFIHITNNNYLMRGGIFTVSIYFLVMLWWELIGKL